MSRSLKSILDAVMDGVVVIDGDGRVEMLNAEACRILEISAATVEGRSLDRLAGNAHPIAEVTRRVLAQGRPAIADEVPIARRFADDLIADLAIAPLSEAGEEDAGAVVVLRDRTIQLSLRDSVAQKEQLASYGHIAAGIAHEVKNPLSGIRGAAELLEVRATDERAERTAALIVREVDRISSLVDELMVFAKGEALERKAVNLHQVLDQVIDLVSVDPLASRLEIDRAYDPSIPDLLADPNRLTQVFLNLARNAMQALDGEAGRLQITTRISLDQRLSRSDGRMGPTVAIEFSDDGPGISEEDLQRLATPFFTTKPKGTGLGLAVARHWVSLHGGTLRVRSVLGEGATVRVSLPLEQP